MGRPKKTVDREAVTTPLWTAPVGIVLLVVPLFFLVAYPERVIEAHWFLVLVSAFGGALVGAWIPGAAHVQAGAGQKGKIRAAGAMSFVLIVLIFAPSKAQNPAQEKEPIDQAVKIEQGNKQSGGGAKPEAAIQGDLILRRLEEDGADCSFAELSDLDWGGVATPNEVCKAYGYEQSFRRDSDTTKGICIHGAEKLPCVAARYRDLRSGATCRRNARLSIQVDCFIVPAPAFGRPLTN